MTKKKIKREIKSVKSLKTWKLVLALILMLFVAATMLRLDYIGMTQRRQAVLNADKSGDQEVLAERFGELKRYVFSHMNASTGKFYLVNQYERDAQAILDRAAKEANQNNPNGNIYKKASDVCDPMARQFGWGYSSPYFNCIQRELKKYSAHDMTGKTVELPSTELYRLDYASPLWTPSFSGFSVLICVVLCLLIIGKGLVALALRLALLGYE